MKKLSISILSILALVAIILFQNCNGNNDENAMERTFRILQSKTWTVSSVVVPASSATEDSDWANFTVTFSASDMTTGGHPTGAQAVWRSGTYSVGEDGKTITRADGVVMTLNPISEENFTAIFTVPEGTELGSRIAALDGEYIFNMK